MVKAAVIVAPGGPVEVREFPEPKLEPGGVLLDTLYSEVCGTDVHLLHGRLAGVPYPLIPGHISVGRVAETNGTVRDVDGNAIRPGTVVTFLDVHGTCYSCWYCLVAKASTRCPSRRVYGITYGAEDGLLGGWSERIHLKPGVRILPLPEELDPLLYMAGGCALPTALHAIDRADLKLGAAVAVQGAGPVGLMATALARLSGAGAVIVLGAPAQRLEAALALGADHAIDIEAVPSDERPQAVRELTGGRGSDITIECTGEPSAIPEGLRMTRDAGTYVVAGQYTDAGEVTINPHADLNRKHLDVRGCWGIDFSHLYRSVQLLARERDRLPWRRVVSREYPLAEAAQALRDVEGRRVVKAVINLGCDGRGTEGLGRSGGRT
jgi:threonine dehydrogenase-like Zn-dependent dehydrogenase